MVGKKSIEMSSIYIEWSVLKMAVEMYKVVSLFDINSSRKIWFIPVEKRNLISTKKKFGQ